MPVPAPPGHLLPLPPCRGAPHPGPSSQPGPIGGAPHRAPPLGGPQGHAVLHAHPPACTADTQHPLHATARESTHQSTHHAIHAARGVEPSPQRQPAHQQPSAAGSSGSAAAIHSQSCRGRVFVGMRATLCACGTLVLQSDSMSATTQALLGDRANQRQLRRHVLAFTRLRRYEHMTLHQACRGLRPQAFLRVSTMPGMIDV